ncbi:g1916 [Coccomyxa elongata]
MLLHVQAEAPNTYVTLLDKPPSTLAGLLFHQLQRDGTPASVAQKYMYWIRLHLNDHLASQAQMATQIACANQGVRERRKQLVCITSMPLRAKEVELLSGPCADYLQHKIGMIVDAVHGDKPRAHRTSTGSGYYEGKLGSDMVAMTQAAGIPKEYGSGTHALRHKGMQNSQLLLNEMEKACRQLDHSGGVHDDYYAFCIAPNIKDSAAMAGHLDGHVRPLQDRIGTSSLNFLVVSAKYEEGLRTADMPQPLPYQPLSGQKRKVLDDLASLPEVIIVPASWYPDQWSMINGP